ncbi:uncharacterized protein LY79DRAFT_566920 [Colletotrichum navitas]|uniref:Secreted protein n=1 Tax=Colletotrichum navitas TaxID=681940 RepID=A0AAD8PR41_9PEZI|nr:uncharacterized protein LY79DRAFT_566920 [Colletotrichum navitas]KAK1574148.1 hypothetical protein LY79DRAFT_566920 [Colletotrichum navitas]
MTDSLLLAQLLVGLEILHMYGYGDSVCSCMQTSQEKSTTTSCILYINVPIHSTTQAHVVQLSGRPEEEKEGGVTKMVLAQPSPTQHFCIGLDLYCS